MKAKTKESTVEKEKLEIIKWVTGLKDRDAIEKLRMLRDNPKKLDWWNEITDEEKAAIDKGMEDIKAGRVRPHKEAKKSYMQSGYSLFWSDRALEDLQNIIRYLGENWTQKEIRNFVRRLDKRLEFDFGKPEIVPKNS